MRGRAETSAVQPCAANIFKASSTASFVRSSKLIPSAGMVWPGSGRPASHRTILALSAKPRPWRSWAEPALARFHRQYTPTIRRLTPSWSASPCLGFPIRKMPSDGGAHGMLCWLAFNGLGSCPNMRATLGILCGRNLLRSLCRKRRPRCRSCPGKCNPPGTLPLRPLSRNCRYFPCYKVTVPLWRNPLLFHTRGLNRILNQVSLKALTRPFLYFG
jgi:hypothetical protein